MLGLQSFHLSKRSPGNNAFLKCSTAKMETFSALLALCAVNLPVTGQFPSQRPVMLSFGVFFNLRLNKRLRKQSRRWWFIETPLRSSIRHYNGRPSWWRIVIVPCDPFHKGFTGTVETLYNTINFCWSTHKRHSIARPKGRGMGCLLWVHRATYCVDLSILSSIKFWL